MMSLVGKKRQFAWCKAMSGVGGKADFPVARPEFSILILSGPLTSTSAPISNTLLRISRGWLCGNQTDGGKFGSAFSRRMATSFRKRN